MHVTVFLVYALFYVLLAWVCAAGAMLWLGAALSMEDMSGLLVTAIRSSVPSMWLVPALVLLTAPVPALSAAGLILIANTTRLLISRSVPPRLAGRMLAPAGLAPAVAGSLAFQSGMCAIWLGYALASACLFVFGTAVWTLSSIARGSFQPRSGRNLRHASLSMVTTVILTVLLSTGVLAMDPDPSEKLSFFQTTQALLSRLAHAPEPQPAPAPKVMPLAKTSKDLSVAGKSGVPGVILRPERKGERQHIYIESGEKRSLTRTLTFPFTSEYHLFLTSSRQLPPDAVVHPGTPLDESYLANTGSSMETEGYQVLHPPVDFRECGKILVGISSGEITPASASVHLVAAGRELDLGSEIFGLDPAAKETLEFKVPELQSSLMVRAIRVLFRRNPVQQDQSTKVAIERFTLVPVLK
jgi:hypothetical protein